MKIYREEEQKRRGSNIDQIRIATDPDHLNRRHFLLFSVFGLDWLQKPMDYQSLGSNIWPNGLVFKKVNPAKLNYGPRVST